MHSPLLAEFVYGIGSTRRPLTPEVIERYRAHAHRLLGESRGDHRQHWRWQAVTLLLGGVVPWIGYVAFGWNANTMLFAIALDAVSAWLGDLTRLLFADRTCRRLLMRDVRARDTVGVARTLRLDPKANMYGVHVPSERPTLRPVVALFAMGLPVAIYVAIRAYLDGAAVVAHEGTWLLLASPLVRLGTAMRYSLAEGNSPAAQQQLLLTSVEPLAAMWLSWFARFMVLASGYRGAVPPAVSVGLYVGAALGLGVFAAWRVWRAEAEVRWFAGAGR